MDEKKIIEGKVKTPALAYILLALGVFVFIFPLYFTSRTGNVLVEGHEWISVLLIVLGAVLLFSVRHCQIIVTNKRIYGTASFNKSVNLPLDSVSAVEKSWLNGITVATSSGKISFKSIPNSAEIYKALCNLLIERQGITKADTSNAPVSNADELKKYKELLDSGVISQEEFDAKKKQLLGL